MRRGRVYKRCSKCTTSLRPADRRCPKCGSESSSWAYVVDVARAGEPRSQKRKAGFATKAAAVAGMNQLQHDKAEGTYVAPSRQTVAQYLTAWLAGGCGGNIRATTLKSYDVAVRVHLVPRIGNIALQQLTRAHVKAVYQELASNGYAKGKSKRDSGLSAKTVHNVALALRKALSDAVADGLLRANPAERAHRLPTDRPEMLTWTALDLRSFLAAAEDTDDYAMWRLAANTGMRRGEVLGLRWRDLDLVAGRVSVRQQLVRSGVAPAFGPPKTRAGRRSIALDSGTVTALRNHQRAQAAPKLLLGAGYADHDLVFCRQDGTPEDPDVVSQRFERACTRAGVRRIRLHDLRHTHATLLLSEGIHPKVVQERLGHSSILVTMNTYSHVLPNLQLDAAARIGAVVDATESAGL